EEEQALAVTAEPGPVIEGRVLELTQRAAQAAANWCTVRSYGPAMTQITQWIAANALDTAELNSVSMEQMALRVLQAQNPDDMLDPFNTVHGKDILDRPLYVVEAMYLWSDIENPKAYPWYVSLTVQRDDDSRTVVTVGGEKLVPQCAGFSMVEGGW